MTYVSERDQATKYLRRQMWNSTQAKSPFQQPVWSAYQRDDVLNLNLEMQPYWVAKSPGTYDHTKERWNLYRTPSPSKLRPQTAGWDSHFTVAHTLDGNPVHNGHRVLQASRRRHNGGIGAEGLV
eukprot:CAMPEP_0115871560 /NCGR_PEP_ID=MMETSP0287-20121206/22940_1 /TAXON_ID=412157 /ORGANISM="Chrysochromulina rotalis, Strain UIO044" /LENGTH=124 /DNA_ID=CAMNT_0003326387 /DNA_START=57 /DNA_END=431 /DNA_ORIENTATION=-